MVRKIKYAKVALVVFITVLIWVWADLAQDEELLVPGVTITIAESTNPSLWVSFAGRPSVSLDNIVLKGPASKIADVKRKLKDGSLVPEFFLDPARQEAMTVPGEHLLDVPNFLQKSDKIRQFGLTVESCEPNTVSVNVVGLVEKSLEVECLGEDQNPVKTKTIEPPKVNMFVPADWEGVKLIAKVQLTRSEIDQARLAPISKKPYIKLAAGQRREAPKPVKITMPPEEDPRSDYTITTATLGFNLSANLQGKYEVKVTNLDAVMSTISIRATAEAKQAYENMRYQVILEIYDSDKDAKSTEPLRRELVYNFPEEYLRKDEIELKQQPVTARFKLIPVSVPVEPSAGQ